MAKVTTKITDKQSGAIHFPNGEIIPEPVMNIPPTQQGVGSASESALQVQQLKKKFILLDQDEKIVATLIDQTLAEKWVADHKKGAVRFIENVINSVV